MPEAPKNRLKELREARGKKTVHVAAAIDREPVTVARYEAQATTIPDDVKQKLADYFGVSIPYLMCWSDDPKLAA